MRTIPCERCPIQATCIVGDLPTDKLDQFRACSVAATYKRRQVVFHEDTPAAGLHLVCYGAVKLYQSDRFGRDHILDIVGPGETLSGLPHGLTERYAVSAEVLMDSQLCYLPRERLVEFVQQHPMVGVRLITVVSRSLSAARRKVRELALKGAEGRLAEVLVQLLRVASEPVANRGSRLMLGCSRRELGEMTGVSPETVIRLLAKLKRKQVVIADHRDIIITDPDKLARIAANDTGT